MGKTLFDKIWDAHIVDEMQDSGPTQLYIDRMFCHEVTSPQAFLSLKKRKLPVFRPNQITCIPDHNTPTKNQHLPIKDPISKNQIDTLERNAKEFGVNYYPIGHPLNGVTHIVGPEIGLSLPGMTIVCGDSHTCTHGALGTLAFGIGTSEVEMVLATQCVFQTRPKTMRITIKGNLKPMISAKDLALYIIAKMTTGGATGYFIEYAGETIENLSMEERLTLCNLSIEMGARGGMISPDKTTFEYIKNCKFAPKKREWEKKVEYWKSLKTDENSSFDKEVIFDVHEIEPMITYGTNPGMGMGINDRIPTIDKINEVDQTSFKKSLEYMGFHFGEKIIGKSIDYVFIGSCTNGRIEDFRTFASFVKGKKKSDHVIVWVVPGSKNVENQIKAEGLDKILENSGFEIRQPGCSACLAMNEDKVPDGKYVVSTSNRNFEGRQGFGSKTILSGILVAAAAAITGKITDPRTI